VTPERIAAGGEAGTISGEMVCAVFVTYNPAPAFYQNVLALAGQVALILIVDNASSPTYQAVLEQAATVPSTEIIRNTSNLGVGAALNIGVRRAIERGFAWVATLDQDSRPGPGFIEEMLRVYTARSDRATIALLAPSYVEAGLGLQHDEPSRSYPDGALVTTSMMSGNLVRTEAISRVGLYDESFFIDYVDHEFCLRLARHGYRVLKCEGSVLQHQLGRMSRTKVAGVLVTTTNHSPLRRYYNARNRVFVYRRYWRVAPTWVARDLRSFVVETLKLLLVEQQRGAKLLNVAKGIWQGLAGGDKPAARR
jgi:rhamnosyltransferase